MNFLAPPHPSATFPRLLLASADASRPTFAGWVGSDASGEDLWLRLEPIDDAVGDACRRTPSSFSNLRSSRLLLSPALQRALKGHEDAVAARLRQSRSASEFFSELKTLLEAVGVAVGGSGRKKRRRSRRGDGDDDGNDDLLPSSSSSSSSPLPRSAFYSALLERLGPRAWSSMTAMREASSSSLAGGSGSGGEGEVLLSFAVPSEEGQRASSSQPPLLRVTLALEPLTFPRSAPRVASADLPQALLRPPLALPIASWWNKGSGGGGDRNKSTTTAKAEKTKSTVDDVLCWLLAAARSRPAAAAFAALDQLDSQAWVLDPPLPAPRARTSRRLAAAAGGRASVEVDFATFFSASAAAASSSSSSSSVSHFFPAPSFSGWLGPEALVTPLREAAEASRSARAGCCWDASKGAVENLEALLLMKRGEGQQQRQQQQQQLPRKPGGRVAAATAETEREGGAAGPEAEQQQQQQQPVAGLGDGAECAICCAYRLDGDDEGGNGGGREAGAAKASSAASDAASLPSVSCENERCGRPFHASCLREWLIAAAGDGGGGGGRGGAGGAGGDGAGVLRGECPYCSEPISVSK